MRGERVLYSIFGVAIALTALLILYPAYHALELSFQDLDSFISKPTWIGLQNYTDVLAMPEFWAALGRGLVFLDQHHCPADCARHRVRGAAGRGHSRQRRWCGGLRFCRISCPPSSSR